MPRVGENVGFAWVQALRIGQTVRTFLKAEIAISLVLHLWTHALRAVLKSPRCVLSWPGRVSASGCYGNFPERTHLGTDRWNLSS